MQVSLWVPVAVAIIGGISVYLAARTPRGLTKEEREGRIAQEARQEAAVITAGFVALVNEMQEDRQVDRAERKVDQETIAKLRQELADCLRARYEDMSQ